MALEKKRVHWFETNSDTGEVIADKDVDIYTSADAVTCADGETVQEKLDNSVAQKSDIGLLNGLKTTDKSSLVSAINEVKDEVATQNTYDEKDLDKKADADGSNATGDWDINITGNAKTATKATSADKLNANAGSATQPTYFSDGVPKSCTYELNKTVPADAVFTDTTYSVATTEKDGLMSAEDKKQVDKIGDTDISGIGDGTATGAVSELNSNMNSNMNIKSISAKEIQIENTTDSYMILKYAQRNLLPNNFNQGIYHDVKYTKNNDGSITINGTSTGTDYGSWIGNAVLDAGTYAMGTVSNAGYGLGDIFLTGVNGDNNNWYTKKTFTLTSRCTIKAYIYVTSGVTIDNLTIYPIILKQNYEPEEYIPYEGYDITSSNSDGSKISKISITPNTTFPVTGLQSYNNLTNVENPYGAIMEVAYANNSAGKAILDGLFNNSEIIDNSMPDKWDSAKTYYTGDYCIENNQLWKCKGMNTGAKPSGSSGSTYWDKVTIASELNSKANTGYAAKSSIYGNTAISMGRQDGSTVGSNSAAFGTYVTASGAGSLAHGYGATASGTMGCYASGYDSVASGRASHAEGENAIASGQFAHAEGGYTTASGSSSHAEGYKTTALNYQHAQGHFNNTNTATANETSGTSSGTAFVIGNGTASSASNAFRITGKGVIYATNATVQTGADYAEYFEWSDGNPNEEDRVGYFVTFDEDNPEKIRIASKDDYILGIVSGMPNIIGNGDECWKQRYILDDFGRYIEETFEYEVEVAEVVEKEVEDEETGETKIVEEVVIHKETKIGTKWKENPEYDPTKPYIPRDERAEWSTIGMLGVLSVRDDGTCQVNGYCKCTDGGIATACEKEIGAYRVIKRVTDNIVKVVLK